MKNPPWIWERASPHATELSQEMSHNTCKNHTKCTLVSGNGTSDPTEQPLGPNQVPPPAKKGVSGAEQGWLFTCTTEWFSSLTLNIDLTLVLTRRHLWSQQSDPKCKNQHSLSRRRQFTSWKLMKFLHPFPTRAHAPVLP